MLPHRFRPTKRLLLAFALTLMLDQTASAQTNGWDGRAFFNIDGASQATTNSFSNTVRFTLNAEEESFDANHAIESGPIVGVRGGVRIWRHLTIGIGVTSYAKTRDAAIHASLPHPFFFNRPRTADGTAPGMKRQETGVHLEATWLLPISEKLDVGVFGGPSHFSVKQDLATRVLFGESYPYDTATFTGIDKTSVSKSRVGFNAGVDVSYLFTKSIGVGGIVRFTRASLPLEAAQGQSVTIKVGGMQAGAGLRVRF